MGVFDHCLGGPIKDSRLGWLLGLCGLKGVGWTLGAIVLPFFARDVIGLNATMLGVQWALNDGVQLIFTPLLGNFSDSVGRKWVIIGCVALIGALMGLTAFCTNATEYIIVRSISGIGQGVGYGAITAMVTDLAGETERARRLGGLFFVVGVSLVVGAGLNAMASHFLKWGYAEVLLVGMALVCAASALSAAFMGESLSASERRPLCSSSETEKEDRVWVTEWWSCGLGLVLIAKAFSACGVMCWQVTYAFFIKDAFGWDTAEFGIILAVCGLIAAVFQSICYPVFDRAVGSHWATSACCAVFAVTCAALPGCSLSLQTQLLNHSGHLTMLTIMGLATACSEVAFPNLVATYVPQPCFMGAAQGATAAAKSVGWFVGPILGGMLYDSRGMQIPYIVGGALSFVAASVILASWLLLPTPSKSDVAEHISLLNGRSKFSSAS
mmetsp:Transcript_11756/g.21977  ORF Transcript_11756/g.21977 Transcript_11756/m.21977 type:complete len:440 (+) Transcript_11756:54-1373(+)